MDKGKIKLPAVKRPKRHQVGELPDYEHWLLSVAANDLNESVAGLCRSAILEWLENHRSEIEDRIKIYSAQRGITPEEYFNEVINRE